MRLYINSQSFLHTGIMKNITHKSSDNLSLIKGLNNANSSIIHELNVTNLLTIASSGSLPISLAILEWLNLYYLGGIIIVGVLGNAINVFAFTLSRLKKKKLRSPSYYLATLALNDTIFLLTLLIIWLNHFGVEIFDWRVIHESTVYLSSTSSCMSGKSN